MEDLWQHRRALESRRHPPSLAIYHDVDVVGGLGFPLQNGDCLVEPGDGFGWNAEHIAHANTLYAASHRDAVPPAHRTGGTIDVLLSFPGGYTYGHWPIDIAARIERAVGIFDRDRLAFIVPGPQQSWMRFHLDAYGIASGAVVTVSDQQTYRAATLAIPLVRFTSYLPPYPYVRSFARLKAYGHRLATDRGNYGERIFVRHRAQTSVGRRRVLNNASEVERELETFGFIPICPTDMTICEQISAFADAKIIVGETSSALHNIIYASEADLIVLQSPSHKAMIHLSVCKILDHSCRYGIGRDIDDGTFSCDLDVVREAVSNRIASSG